MSKTAILGACTAYGIARKYGYTGTEEEWNALQNSLKEEAKTYATNAAESATAASTSEKNAATSEANAKTYMDSAEAYKNSAFSATPEGYESNMQKLADMDIQTATGESLCISDTCAGGIKLNSIKGKSVQGGEPTPDAPVEIESVGDSGSVKVTSCGRNLFMHNVAPLYSWGAVGEAYNPSLGMLLKAGTYTIKSIINEVKKHRIFCFFFDIICYFR